MTNTRQMADTRARQQFQTFLNRSMADLYRCIELRASSKLSYMPRRTKIYGVAAAMHCSCSMTQVAYTRAGTTSCPSSSMLPWASSEAHSFWTRAANIASAVRFLPYLPSNKIHEALFCSTIVTIVPESDYHSRAKPSSLPSPTIQQIQCVSNTFSQPSPSRPRPS